MKNITFCLALFSLSAGLTSAQTFTTLLRFGSTCETIRNPTSPLVQSTDGTLYGMTSSALFKIQPDGSGLTALSWFILGSDGLVLDGSTLYGTSKYGGTYLSGTVFKINTNGTGYTVLWNFKGPDDGDGQLPNGKLLLAGGTLFGTTEKGGYIAGQEYSGGTVFKVSTDGSSYMVLKNFDSGDATYDPRGGLVLAGDTIYGACSGGLGFGAVFKLNTNGTGFTVIKNFNGSDGDAPNGSLELVGNTLYGTTQRGGNSTNGTVFKLNTDGTSFTMLKSFNGADGENPQAGLTLLGNIIYGVTKRGGNSTNGTVFKLNTDGSDFSVLNAFSGTNGANPNGKLVLADNTLYGATENGGSFGGGTVFKLNGDGTDHTVLRNLDNGVITNLPLAEGSYPILTVAGNTIFGTTSDGPANGTVFKVNTDGTGYTLLKTFSDPDGYPQSRLTLENSTLYGTTVDDNMYGFGTIFRINTDGTDYNVIKRFSTNDGWSANGLTLSGNTLYGTTAFPNSSGDGMVFKINTDGTGFELLLTKSDGLGGYSPLAGLTLDGSTLYGTMSQGSSSGNYIWDFGTVFKLSTNGTGYTTLKNFNPDGSDGLTPVAGLTLVSNRLYGTTTDGGVYGRGTIFGVNTDGTGFTVIKSFDDWSYIQGARAPIILAGNAVYGIDGGAIFKIGLDGSDFTIVKDFTGGGEVNEGAPVDLTRSGNILYGATRNSIFSLSLFSPPQSFSAHLTNDNQLAVQFVGTANYAYALQAATNLTPPVIWQSVVTNSTDGVGLWQYTDTNLNSAQKFYRAIGL